MANNKILKLPDRPKAAENLKEEPILRIAVCIPGCERMDPAFALNLARCMILTGATLGADGLADIWIVGEPGEGPDSLNNLVRAALAGGATHLLWLKPDTTFPADVVVRLLRHNTPIVTVNTATPRTPVRVEAIKRLSPDGAHAYLRSGEEAMGLEEVEASGLAVTLIQARIFENMAPPVFLTEYDKEARSWKGPDVFFCEQARRAGYRIMVDQGLSNLVGRAGRMVYRLDHARVTQECEQESGASGIIIPEGVMADGAINVQ